MRFSPGKPGRPGEPTVKDVQKNAVELVWTAPDNDGGAPITNYVIEYCEEGMFKWHPANEDDTVIITRYNVKGLKEKTNYKFRVAAENKGGVGPFAECAMTIKVQEPIGKKNCSVMIDLWHGQGSGIEGRGTQLYFQLKKYLMLKTSCSLGCSVHVHLFSSIVLPLPLPPPPRISQRFCADRTTGSSQNRNRML